MDIYELLKEENQLFWDVLNVEQTDLSTRVMSDENNDENYIIEEIEMV